MKLSGEEGRRFDNVNELWKVDASMVVARDVKFQQELFKLCEKYFKGDFEYNWDVEEGGFRLTLDVWGQTETEDEE